MSSTTWLKWGAREDLKDEKFTTTLAILDRHKFTLKLTNLDIRMIGKLVNHIRVKKGHTTCFPSQRTLSLELGVARTSSGKSLNRLIKLGLIKLIYGEMRKAPIADNSHHEVFEYSLDPLFDRLCEISKLEIAAGGWKRYLKKTKKENKL